LFLVLWLLTGCIYPHTSERSSEVRGRVLDSQTHLPLKGAKICFVQKPQYPTYTDANGRFQMKARRNFHWSGNAGGGSWPFPKIGSKIISHPNYVTIGWDGSGDAGDILLQPKP
jgi:hypothetical protein